MNIIATFHKILSEESGTSKSGNAWEKATIKITYQSGKYEKELYPTVWGSDIAICRQMPSGTIITAGVELSGREYSGKYYNDIKLFAVKKDTQTSTPSQYNNGGGAPSENDWKNDKDFVDSDGATDDLPF